MIELNELYKLLLSIFLGGLIGFERQYRSKAAGFRTIIIICVGTTLFSMFSPRFGWGDPSRLAAGIVTGIGFLGAGAIIRNEGMVSGLTTAATIWFVAAVGIGIGLGYYLLSTISVLIVLFVLGFLPYFEFIIEKIADFQIFEIEIKNLDNEVELLSTISRKKKVKVIDYKVEKIENNTFILTFKLKGKKKNIDLLSIELIKKDFIRKLKIR